MRDLFRPFCNFPQPREAHPSLGGIDRLFVIRASAPIRFPRKQGQRSDTRRGFFIHQRERPVATNRKSIHQRAEIRSDKKRKNSKKGVIEVAAIIEGKTMNLSIEAKVAIAVATSFVVLMVGAMAQG